MKISYLLGIILLAVLTGILISTLSAPSTYAGFTEAFDNPQKEFTVVGQLNEKKEIHYNPVRDANQVVFPMVDKEGVTRIVVLAGTKPQDMERSEDIVVKGKAVDDQFHAHTILLKCPSKYEEQNSFTPTAN